MARAVRRRVLRRQQLRLLDDEGNVAFVRAVASALKPGARFVLETPMILENLLGHLQDRPWWKVGDTHLLVVNAYDATRGIQAVALQQPVRMAPHEDALHALARLLDRHARVRLHGRGSAAAAADAGA